jgi:hypothetical protein
LAEERAAELRKAVDAWEQSSFSARRTASRVLEDAGIQAYDILADAATQHGRETTHRALEILERGLRQSDPAMKSAARVAVARIADSSNAPAARLAKELLSEVDRPPSSMAWANPNAGRMFNRGGFGGFVPPPQLGPPLGPNPFNRVRTFRVSDQDSITIIRVDDAGRIQLEITQLKVVPPVTERISVASEAELRARFPQAHQRFARFSHLLRNAPQAGAPLPRSVQEKADFMRQLEAMRRASR